MLLSQRDPRLAGPRRGQAEDFDMVALQKMVHAAEGSGFGVLPVGRKEYHFGLSRRAQLAERSEFCLQILGEPHVGLALVPRHDNHTGLIRIESALIDVGPSNA